MRANKQIIQVKVESSYGVDAAPVTGVDDMLVSNIQWTPANIIYDERDNALPYFGSQEMIPVGQSCVVEFDMELAGSGAVATKPPYSPILRGCAMSETITPTTGPTIYALTTSGEESATLNFNWDGECHKMLGAYGNMDIRLNEQKRLIAHYRFEGLYGGVAASAFGTPVLTGFQMPLAVNKANTTFSLHGYAATLLSLSINQGNTFKYVNRPNAERMEYDGKGRKSTGKVTIELPKVASKAFVDICKTGTTGILSVVHGTTAGNKVLIYAPKAQLTNPTYSIDGNSAIINMDMVLLPTSAGNDEWTLKTQ